ncbi:MAG: hypothetical protein HQL69_06700 [Magnetococcales bacterium]|nr:hypothetical protein [Magnetococcales bacterium]
MSNYFAAEELILNQLQSLTDGFKLINTGRSIKELFNHPGPVPALYLIYDGQKPFMGAGVEQVIDQQWLLVVVVRCARETTSGTFERLEAGPLINSICSTLLGWKPNSDYGPLTLTTAPGPIYNNGYGYYPICFSTRFTIKGTVGI